jgi:hypothetical protein
MTNTITIRCHSGARTVPVVWRGANLAVHRPPTEKGGLNTAPRLWAISHAELGLAACARFEGPKAKAVALAKLWDAAFAEITASGDARHWRFRKTWAHDLAVAQRGTSEPDGPVLPDCPTAGDVAAAISAAIAGGYQPVPEDDGAEQYPARETVAASLLRDGADGLEMIWCGKWWPVPTMGEVEAWALFDGVAETPDGRTVEPDAPDAWPVLLGVI